MFYFSQTSSASNLDLFGIDSLKPATLTPSSSSSGLNTVQPLASQINNMMGSGSSIPMNGRLANSGIGDNGQGRGMMVGIPMAQQHSMMGGRGMGMGGVPNMQMMGGLPGAQFDAFTGLGNTRPPQSQQSRKPF